MKLSEISRSAEFPNQGSLALSTDGQGLVNGYADRYGEYPEVVYMLDQGFPKLKGSTKRTKGVTLFGVEIPND